MTLGKPSIPETENKMGIIILGPGLGQTEQPDVAKGTEDAF